RSDRQPGQCRLPAGRQPHARPESAAEVGLFGLVLPHLGSLAVSRSQENIGALSCERRRNAMPLSALQLSSTDPKPIFEHFRGSYATELLTAAVAHFNLFGRLAQTPLALQELRDTLGVAERPALVLTTALRAMGLLEVQSGRFSLTPQARE